MIVIIVIGILATLVIVTFTGIQQKARDSQRQTDINAVDSHVEAFYAQYGYYPTLKDLQTASFLSTYMKGLDPQALVSPEGGDIAAAATNTGAWNYGYVASRHIWLCQHNCDRPDWCRHQQQWMHKHGATRNA